jgi:CheY-like chemotaxis protein
MSDAVQRDLIQLALTRQGCKVEVTREPLNVLEIVSSQHPSLLILDTFLPGSSGLEVLKNLNKANYLKHTKVILISSYGFPEVIQQAKDAGVSEFMMKPVDIDDLLLRTKSLLKI